MSAVLPTPSEPLRGDHEGNFFDKIIELSVDYFWIVLTFAILGLLYGIVDTWRTMPTYNSYGLIKIENKDSGVSFLFNSPAQNSNSLAGEAIEIVTRKVLLNVVESLNLDVIIQPKFYPYFGQAWARDRNNAIRPLPPPLPFPGLSPYAWGGERYELKVIKIPDFFNNRRLTIVADDERSFSLYSERGELLGKSRSNSLDIQVPAANDNLKIEFEDFFARPGTVFYLYKFSKIDVAEQLKKEIFIKEDPIGSNVLQISTTKKNPILSEKIVNAIIKSYARENLQTLSEETEQQIQFVDEQLVELRSTLEEAEDKFNNYRKENGVQTLSTEAQDILSQYNSLSATLANLRLEKIDIEQRYTAQHPLRLQHNKKIAQIESLLKELDTKMQNLPGSDLEALRLERDVNVTTEIYVLLINKSQELRLLKAGILGNARILEYALPGKLIPSQPLRNILLNLFLGIFAGIGLAFLLKVMKKSIEETEALEELTGKSVYISIPRSALQQKWSESLKRSRKIKKQDSEYFILAAKLPDDPAIEALRSLRSTLHFARSSSDKSTNNNHVCILSPTPNIGKSFISVNLAYLIAEAENKVLLIDTDLRKGTIHRYFKDKRQPGLSDLIAGTHDFKSIRRVVNPFFDYIPSGNIPPNPSELLINQRFHKWLENISGYYQYLIIDTAPIINVADGLAIAREASLNFMAVRSDYSLIDDVKIAMARAHNANVNIKGFILNDINFKKARYLYGRYRNYGRYYKAYK